MWPTLYGLEPDGAVLVRPDGYVGWRSRGGVDNPARVLSQVLDSILGLH
jgi:putative polyketide hydroxylase